MSATLLDAPVPHTRHHRSRSTGHQRKPKQKIFVPDTIDRLDDTAWGGYYHHGGPYDATRPSFNINKKLSPLAATKEGNRAAWEATPREMQLDALTGRHPLDGVGVIPPGERSMDGQIMNYEDGEDLMRELSPGGGAYKRWPGRQYHPDDLKGKGEPGYTIDLERKRREAAQIGRSRSARVSDRRGDYEMVPQQHSSSRPRDGGKAPTPVLVRQRSSSASAVVGSSSGSARPRSGSNLAEGLKRRFGSLRRKS